jgi:hypothetical protein
MPNDTPFGRTVDDNLKLTGLLKRRELVTNSPALEQALSNLSKIPKDELDAHLKKLSN